MKIVDKIFKKEEKYDYPWHRYLKEEDRYPEVPDLSIYEYFEGRAQLFLDGVALDYFGVKITFKDLLEKIDIFARAMKCNGVRKGDVVTICMPNTPEAVIAFYAVNKIGAIANMLHPLSSEEEIKNSINTTKSVLLIAINIAFEKINNIISETNVYKVVIVSPKDSMPPLLGLGYMLAKEMSLNIPTDNEFFMSWNEFYVSGVRYQKDCLVKGHKDDDAVMLHSGGTTGIPKNIVITNGNVNIVMKQIAIVMPEMGEGDNILAILPMFHCFGLVACMCGMLCVGVTCSLIPQFDASRFDKLIRKNRPTILAGVPTLYQALISNPYMRNLDMSFIKYVVSGGDSLSPEKNEEVNNFLKEHGCKAHVIQGYGLTESTGGSCIGGLGSDKLGSCGIPLPGNVFKILSVDTKEELKYGEIGEICISGPCVMSRYLDNPEETEKMVVTDENGVRWIHTGDLGYMDSDGVLFFVQRLKRMLIVSGYNVYPAHIEDLLLKFPGIKEVGVIGVPHPYKVQVPKAYVVLDKGVEGNAQMVVDIKEYCKKNMAKYMIPKEIVFRDSLPKTMVGKVDYKELEKENQK